VLPPEVRQQFQAAHTLATDTNDIGVLHPLLRRLSERIGRRLRQRQLMARRLSLRLVYADFTELRKGIPLRSGNLDVELWNAARQLFTKANVKRIAIRNVTLAADRLLEADGQLDLWRTPSPVVQRETELQGAIDCIADRWGGKGVRRGQRTTLAAR
jgi:DNA polymerase-4